MSEEGSDLERIDGILSSHLERIKKLEEKLEKTKTVEEIYNMTIDGSLFKQVPTIKMYGGLINQLGLNHQELEKKVDAYRTFQNNCSYENDMKGLLDKITADYILIQSTKDENSERIGKLEDWKRTHLGVLHEDILQKWLKSHNKEILELRERFNILEMGVIGAHNWKKYKRSEDISDDTKNIAWKFFCHGFAHSCYIYHSELDSKFEEDPDFKEWFNEHWEEFKEGKLE